jgi:hypothetical protein
MRLRRIVVTAGIALILVATTNTSVATPGSEGAESPESAGAERLEPLPPTAITPVRASGRWFAITHHAVASDAAQQALSVVDEARPTGRQSLIEITGVAAPQRFAFDVALPGGARLVADGAGLAALDAEGRSIGALEAPWAVDAAGVAVPTRFEVVDRDTFVQVVEHRTVATYPVYADPWWVVPVAIRVGARIIGRYVVKRATYEAAKRAAAKMAAKQAQMDIDDLVAKSPVKLLKLTRANFRENVRRRTGWRKASIKPYDAHHTLPVKFNTAFSRAGINIHNPVYGHWWCRSAHRSFAARYNRVWDRWLSHDDRRDKIRNTSWWRNTIERKRIKVVSTSDFATTYQCQNQRKRWVGTP